MTPLNQLPEEEWRTLARQASEEEDPDKVLELALRIVEKYEEEKRGRYNLIPYIATTDCS